MVIPLLLIRITRVSILTTYLHNPPHPRGTRTTESPRLRLAALPTRAERTVEPTNTVHILPVLRLRLLPRRAGVVPQHLLPLGRAETADPHHGRHVAHAAVLDLEFLLFLLVFVHGLGVELGAGLVLSVPIAVLVVALLLFLVVVAVVR